MKGMKRDVLIAFSGMMMGAALFCGSSAAAGITAELSANPIYVDGQRVEMTAYKIGGNNYVKLRDVGKAVGFNVYWQNGVQIDSDAPYTGEAPVQGTADSGLAANAEIREEMIRRINEVRKENGVAELPVSNAIMDAAQDIAEKRLLNHGPYEWESLEAHGWTHGAGVNLTRFNGLDRIGSIAEHAVENWVNSTYHFQTMIDSRVTCIGVGVTVYNGTAYAVMIAGDPNSISPIG